MATETAVDVVMPQMGVSVSEGTITKWLKQEGEQIEADEPLLEISTDNFFFQAEDGIRGYKVTGVQTCALPIASTGKGAVQVLVDRYTGRSMPEMGPNMMWNAKYGKVMMQEMMSGSEMMMGGASTIPPASAIAEAQAKRSADQFLSGYLPGATA